MNRPSSFAALATTLLVHAAAVALLTAGFEPHEHELPKVPELAIELIRPQLPQAAAPTPLPKPVPPKPQTEPKPRPVARPTPSPQPIAPQPAQPAATPSAPAASTAPATPAAPAQPVRTGVMVSASYIATETAKWYPRMAIRNGDEGTVLLRVYVAASGRAEKVELRKRSESPLLDEAAIGLAKSLTYVPAKLDGNPVADWFDFPVVFKLRS
jgi:protein TonB